MAVPVRRRIATSTVAVAIVFGALAAAPVSAAAPSSRAESPAGIEVVNGTPSERTGPRPAARMTFNARPGKYKGHFYTSEGERMESFKFRVTRNGRWLKKFYTVISVICNFFPPEVQVHPMGFPRVKINRRHKFYKVWRPNDDTRILLKGRFRGRRLVSGKLDYTVGVCVRTGFMKARRVGP